MESSREDLCSYIIRLTISFIDQPCNQTGYGPEQDQNDPPLSSLSLIAFVKALISESDILGFNWDAKLASPRAGIVDKKKIVQLTDFAVT